MGCPSILRCQMPLVQKNEERGRYGARTADSRQRTAHVQTNKKRHPPCRHATGSRGIACRDDWHGTYHCKFFNSTRLELGSMYGWYST